MKQTEDNRTLKNQGGLQKLNQHCSKIQIPIFRKNIWRSETLFDANDFLSFLYLEKYLTFWEKIWHIITKSKSLLKSFNLVLISCSGAVFEISIFRKFIWRSETFWDVLRRYLTILDVLRQYLTLLDECTFQHHPYSGILLDFLRHYLTFWENIWHGKSTWKSACHQFEVMIQKNNFLYEKDFSAYTNL